MTDTEHTVAGIRNILNELRFVDRHEIEEQGYSISDREWELFRRNPHDQFVRCPDKMQEAIVKAINWKILMR